AMADLTGEIQQVPSAVSAVKVGGERSYRRVRHGDEVELQPRTVTVREFTLHRMRRVGSLIDLDVTVVCSSGTYVRALARDLGARLGVGGHLTMLRRTRVGVFGLEQSKSIPDLEREFEVLPIAEVAAASFPRHDVDEKTARLVAYGQKLPGVVVGGSLVGVFAPDGRFLALYEDTESGAKPVAVFAG
ncbi:MAG TPA: tRNA pseudouridine(55) synthase TruB, partial [Actinopolymorphaceae bacterium]